MGARDPDRAAALFTENAAYHEMPFDAPKAGRRGIRDYWATVTADQRDVDFKSNVVAINGPNGNRTLVGKLEVSFERRARRARRHIRFDVRR